jgi:hypothetical protein
MAKRLKKFTKITDEDLQIDSNPMEVITELPDENSELDKELKKPEDRTWISLGNRMFHIEDVQSMYIQANHLIINFDYTDKQVVIHFGRDEKGTENAKIVFESLREMYGAYKVNLPEGANLYPDLMETAYGDQVRREIQSRVHFETNRYKERHKNKLRKLTDELTNLKKKMMDK